MDPERYTAAEVGRPVRVGTGEGAYWAFAPAPIPRSVSLSADAVYELSEADRALGALSGLGARLPNPHLLIQPYLRREAVASTRIEGTQSSLSDVLSVEAQQRPESPDQREVLNYVRAFERGLNELERLPLSNRLIRAMHAELLAGVRGDEKTPGEFRRSQNWIQGHGPGDAFFVPPPPDLVPDALADFERFLHEEVRIPVLVRCALLHYQFEAIHPFLDGNGRLGRLLVVFFLVERKILPQPLLYLSAYFERQRGEYVDGLQAVRERGDFEGWIRFFVRGVAIQAQRAVDTADTLLALRETYRGRLREIRARGQVVDAAELLIGNPFVTAPYLAHVLHLTRQGAQYVLGTLERAEIVTPAQTEYRPALYVASEVLATLQRDG